jgi:hypothetical protein
MRPGSSGRIRRRRSPALGIEPRRGRSPSLNRRCLRTWDVVAPPVRDGSIPVWLSSPPLRCLADPLNGARRSCPAATHGSLSEAWR